MELERLDIIRREDGSLTCNGFAEMKTELEKLAETYAGIVFTADDIKAAKEYRARLNSYKNMAKAELTQRRKEELAKLEDFDRQIKELVSIIDKPITAIDEQIKAFEEEEKAKKREKCMQIFANTENVPDWLEYGRIENPKWLNATYKISDINKEIIEKVAKINTDIELINELPGFNFEAIECYKRNLDASAAIAEGKRLANIQKMKEEAAAAEKERQERMAQAALENEARTQAEADAEPVKEPEPVNVPAETEKANTTQNNAKEWMTLKIKVDVSDFDAFEEWANQRGIEWRMV